jgi:hypothetical protein
MATHEVPEEFRLSFLVGEIVRNDVYAEHEMRLLWGTLHSAGLSGEGEEPHRDFARVIRQVGAQLARPEVPADFRKLAKKVVDATGIVHKYRAGLVHDLLVEGPWMRGKVMAAFSDAPPRGLDELQKCADDLKVLTWRLRGLWIIASSWVGGPVMSYATADGFRSWTRVAMGHIKDDSSTIVGTKGPCPEPPGGYLDGPTEQDEDAGFN